MASTNANISALALNPQNYVVPKINGSTLGFALTASSTQVLSQNTQAAKIIFHNPGATNPVFVCQATDMNGNALVPGQSGGNWEIFPGGFLEVTGNGTGVAWLASCPAGAGFLTLDVSQTP